MENLLTIMTCVLRLMCLASNEKGWDEEVVETVVGLIGRSAELVFLKRKGKIRLTMKEMVQTVYITLKNANL